VAGRASPRHSWARGAQGIRSRVAALKSRGEGFVGHALLPGEPYDIRGLVAVIDGEADIKVPPADGLYRYYRYSVDERARWEHGCFAPVNALLAEANERFSSLHTRDDGDFAMDEFEMTLSESLLGAVLQRLKVAKEGAPFGRQEPILAVWVSDSDHPIIAESVRRLNPQEVAREFLAEFG
jgi:hypothetical protein